MSEVNLILVYAESYRNMARDAKNQGDPETVSMWSVAVDLERNIAPILDRVTAERDALAQNLKFAEEGSQSFAEECDALQQRLTAEDERADVLEGLLGNAYEAAARWVEKRCDAYVDEHGSSDPETGTVEFPGDGEEYVGELIEIAEGLRALKPAEGGGDEYRKSCEVAHKALSMENQRIVAPGQFKCLACGDIHPGSGNLPCPKMSPTA